MRCLVSQKWGKGAVLKPFKNNIIQELSYFKDFKRLEYDIMGKILSEINWKPNSDK